jgi:hypothetical protein
VFASGEIYGTLSEDEVRIPESTNAAMSIWLEVTPWNLGEETS